MAKRIGPALARRPLHFFWLLDVSGSMSVDDKIGSLNQAIRSAIPHLRAALADNPGIELFVRAVTFAHDAQWHLEEATPVADFQWADVEVVEKGTTEVGRAIALVTEKIAELQEVGRGLPPVLILVSDGKPTDFKQPSFGAALRGLEELVWGKKASRIAIGIGDDVDDESLRRFMGHDEVDPIRADSPEDLLNYIRWASTVVVGDAARGAPMHAVPVEPEPLEVPLPEDLKAYNERKAGTAAKPAAEEPLAAKPIGGQAPQHMTSPNNDAPIKAAPIVPLGMVDEPEPDQDRGLEPAPADADDAAASALLSRRVGRPRPSSAQSGVDQHGSSGPRADPRGADSDVAAEPDIAPTSTPSSTRESPDPALQSLADSLPKAEPEPANRPSLDSEIESPKSVLDVPLEPGRLSGAQRRPVMDLPDPAPSFVQPGGMPPPSFDIRPQAPTPGPDPAQDNAEDDDTDDGDASWS